MSDAVDTLLAALVVARESGMSRTTAAHLVRDTWAAPWTNDPATIPRRGRRDENLRDAIMAEVHSDPSQARVFIEGMRAQAAFDAKADKS